MLRSLFELTGENYLIVKTLFAQQANKLRSAALLHAFSTQPKGTLPMKIIVYLVSHACVTHTPTDVNVLHREGLLFCSLFVGL